MELPINYIYNCKEISKYFTKKTGKTCHFTQNKKTMLLNIENKVLKENRIFLEDEVMDINKIISIFEKRLMNEL